MSKILIRQVGNLFLEAIFSIPTLSPMIALTIDDVGDDSTSLILNAINDYNQSLDSSQDYVRATFFIITSYLESNSDILTKIINQGHEIGNHGVYDRTHADLTQEEFAQELNQAHNRLNQCHNFNIKWFRPGRGWYNQKMFSVLKQATQKWGYYPQFALASFIPLDTFKITENPDFTYCYISQFIFSGAIWVIHGGDKTRADNTAKLLTKILPLMRQNQYQIVTLTELFKKRKY